jgi:hypothetical protein
MSGSDATGLKSCHSTAQAETADMSQAPPIATNPKHPCPLREGRLPRYCR